MNTPIVSAVHWGPDLITLYNAAYAPALAERHPWALGKSFSEVWSEIWNLLGPQIATVLKTGRGLSTERQNLKMNRSGALIIPGGSTASHPLYGDEGQIAGINVTALDVTVAEVAELGLRGQRDALPCAGNEAG